MKIIIQPGQRFKPTLTTRLKMLLAEVIIWAVIVAAALCAAVGAGLVVWWVVSLV